MRAAVLLLLACACAGGASPHLRGRGAGPPVLLLGAGPGVCGDADLLAFAPLAATHALRTFDYRGCGAAAATPPPYSLAADLADVGAAIAQLPAPPWLVAHSYGAMLALRWALTHPGAVRGLVLIAPALDGAALRAHGDARAARLGDDAPRWRELGARLMQGRATDADARAFWTLEGAAQVAEPARWPAIAARTTLAPPPLAAIQPDLARYDVRAELPRLALPVLVVAGADDAIVGDQPRALAAAVPGAELHVVPAAGHWPHHEVPATIEVIAAFLARTRP